MFHIFHLRRQRRDETATTADLTTDRKHKKFHWRRHCLQIYHGKQSFERLFHIRRHQSSSDHDTRQVIMNG